MGEAVVVGAKTDLWSLVLRPGMIDARQLYAALGDIALDPEPDYRTRLLAHESLEALAAVWGARQLSIELARHPEGKALRRMWEERFDETGFPSLRTHVVEATSAESILRMLRDLGHRLSRPTRLTIGGSSSLMLAHLLVRQTEDVDIVDELPAAVRAEPGLVDDLAARHKLRLTHFASHYLPDNWESRVRSLGRFQKLEVEVVDPLDILAGKLFSRRSKDLDDLVATWPLLDRDALRQRIGTSTARLRADPSLAEAAKINWYILSGENNLP